MRYGQQRELAHSCRLRHTIHYDRTQGNRRRVRLQRIPLINVPHLLGLSRTRDRFGNEVPDALRELITKKNYARVTTRTMPAFASTSTTSPSLSTCVA